MKNIVFERAEEEKKNTKEITQKSEELPGSTNTYLHKQTHWLDNET